MPIFVELTDYYSGNPVWVNTSKVITMYFSKDGGTAITIDGDANFKVKETPQQVKEAIRTALADIGKIQ